MEYVLWTVAEVAFGEIEIDVALNHDGSHTFSDCGCFKTNSQ